METTVKERLVEYLRCKKIGQNKFEKSAGIANGYISNLKRAPGVDVLTKILDAAPDLNYDWLVYGKGPMLVGDVSGNVVMDVKQGDNSTINNGNQANNDLLAEVERLRAEVEFLREQCKAKDAEKIKLLDMMNKLLG